MKIVLNKNQKVWFISDTHYAHANICSATSRWINKDTGELSGHVRKFDSLDEMNTTLVNNINNVVAPDDIVFHLGDWSFGGFDKIVEFRNRLHCKNIHLIVGNHDHHIFNNKDNVRSLFASVREYAQVHIKWQSSIKNAPMHSATFILMHYPIASWNYMRDGAYHLHGHVHLPKHMRIGAGRMMDVGVDGNDMQPIEMSQVISLLENQPIKGLLDLDHHEQSNY
jgi:calcineurin-like phosphoesterase family protein